MNKPKIGTVMERLLPSQIIRKDDDADNERRFSLSFSSEEPYERYFGVEVLDHEAKAVDLSRLKNIGVLLFNHDPYRVLGKPLSVAIKDYRGEAEVEFDDDDEAETIRKKVESGTLKGVSVRYSVEEWEEIPEGKKSDDGKYKGPLWVARKWTPLEISIVSVPADASVGVGRAMQREEFDLKGKKETTTTVEPVLEKAEKTVEPNAEEVKAQIEDAAQKAAEKETQRCADITAMCAKFGLDPQEHISEKRSVADVQKAILDELSKKHTPVSVQTGDDERGKFLKAATDGVLLRGGVNVAKPADGANEHRTMKMETLLRKCAQIDGAKDALDANLDDLLRQYFTPTSTFTALMDQTINKAYAEGYEQAPTTFELWVAEGTLTDFKPTQNQYRPGTAGEFLPVPEGGEIKHDVYADEVMPERKLNTYGRQFTLSRQTIINDDLGMVTRVPANYAASARKTQNKQVYSILANNPVIYDGTPLFSAAHGNLINPATAPNITSIEHMIKTLGLMKDNNGNPIMTTPEYLIVPYGMGITVLKLIETSSSVTINGNTVSAENNMLSKMRLKVIEDPFLNTLSTDGDIAWYLAASKTSVPSIQIDYLNGNKAPIVRMMEYPGQLGMIWDFWLDWGISVADYRGIIKNPGQA